MNGKKYSGYDIVKSDEDMFVKEIFRPSPLDAYQNIVKISSGLCLKSW